VLYLFFLFIIKTFLFYYYLKVILLSEMKQNLSTCSCVWNGKFKFI
jgi:hypothetical protein